MRHIRKVKGVCLYFNIGTSEHSWTFAGLYVNLTSWSYYKYCFDFVVICLFVNADNIATKIIAPVICEVHTVIRFLCVKGSSTDKIHLEFRSDVWTYSYKWIKNNTMVLWFQKWTKMCITKSRVACPVNQGDNSRFLLGIFWSPIIQFWLHTWQLLLLLALQTMARWATFWLRRGISMQGG